MARAATLVEQGGAPGRELISRLFAQGGRAKIIGITGPAGSGKSTLVNACIRYLRAKNSRVGVIAVDPSSSLSQGAILGDRIRMMEHYADDDVFIRSAANRGRLGGLSGATLDLCILLDAANYEFIFVETVGVGQDEVEIVKVADVTAVVLPPASGDDVQAIKAGIMEIADVFAVNKADLPGAEQLVEEIGFVQSLSPSRKGAPICRTIASGNAGIQEFMIALTEALEEQRFSQRRQTHWVQTLSHLVSEKLLRKVDADDLARHAELVSRRVESPYDAADQLIARILLKGDRHEC